MHGAGAALALVAAFLGSGEAEMIAQRIQQRDARFKSHRMDALVDFELHADGGIVHEHSASGCAQAAASTAQRRPHGSPSGPENLVEF
jgi:hypothetical protein